jgi:hypothetical protein
MFLLALWDRSRKVARPAPIELATRFRVNDAFEDIINRYEE